MPNKSKTLNEQLELCKIIGFGTSIVLWIILTTAKATPFNNHYFAVYNPILLINSISLPFLTYIVATLELFVSVVKQSYNKSSCFIMLTLSLIFFILVFINYLLSYMPIALAFTLMGMISFSISENITELLLLYNKKLW